MFMNGGQWQRHDRERYEGQHGPAKLGLIDLRADMTDKVATPLCLRAKRPVALNGKPGSILA